MIAPTPSRYDADGEPMPCRSRFVGHVLAAPGAVLLCAHPFDHREVGGDDDHGHPVGGHVWARWSDADADLQRRLIAAGTTRQADNGHLCPDCLRSPCIWGAYCQNVERGEDCREYEEADA
jgi:hypothetical protein